MLCRRLLWTPQWGRWCSTLAATATTNANTTTTATNTTNTHTNTTPNVGLDYGTTTTPDVTIVRDADTAARVVAQLMDMKDGWFHAVDTEVADIDVAHESPVGNGRVVCMSVYSGPDVDFGTGPRLWVDNLGDAEGTLDVFKPFLEAKDVKKVYHNYGFDRHVLGNHGIDVQGLGADTMHMARLWTTTRAKTKGGYSLESLTADLLHNRKVPMKERFGVPKLKKDGTPGKEVTIPPVDVIQTTPEFRDAWIDYSTYDTEGTWRLREVLEAHLRDMPWSQDKTMFDFYTQYLVPYAHVLTDLEREGIRVDVQNLLPAAEARAKAERVEAAKRFTEWAVQYCPDAQYMNIGSDVQKAHFLFAPTQRTGKAKAKKGQPPVVLGTEGTMAADATEWPEFRAFQRENTEGFIEEGKKKAKKNVDFVLRGLGMTPPVRTASGWPAASAAVLRTLAGDPEADPPVYGTAYDHFGGGEPGKAACNALWSLLMVSTIETMLSNFILPLQSMADSDGRVHCSLNLNTETGRLSARRPNLQNQPALEKDRYRIRQAFTCNPGNRLIVADYGQLELRLLAHMTSCQSMIDAFEAGGDFHSRTALGMYPHIQEAVAAGKVQLEVGDGAGEGDGDGDGGGAVDPDAPPVLPLVKSVFATERRKAKVLNFSIAYGKTPLGLSRDWGVSLSEAKDTLAKWYADRPEVADWQEQVKARAHAHGVTRTLMGRYRQLPGIHSRSHALRARAERAAINTPIQGGAADVVMMAMLKVARNEVLARLGWTMLLQIHDELILEGPAESVDEALHHVINDMSFPFQHPLRVDLVVDATSATTWYDAK